jgi:hypothetical protein
MGNRSGVITQRLSRILKHPNSWISVIFGLLVLAALSYLHLPTRHGEVRVAELSQSILTFTSMGFAVSTTAVALILAMPLGRVTALMVVNSNKSPPVQIKERESGKLQAVRDGSITGTIEQSPAETAYLELIAVFLVTALANVASSAAVIVWATFIGGDDLLSSHAVENNVLTAVVATLVAYSGAQMITAIRTLYQVAVLVQGVMRASLFDRTDSAAGPEE